MVKSFHHHIQKAKHDVAQHSSTCGMDMKGRRTGEKNCRNACFVGYVNIANNFAHDTKFLVNIIFCF